MPLKIKQDHSRFREIIRGRIKNNLRKYIQKGEMIGKKGKDLITIPVPSIDIPHFRYGHKDQGGVGQGDGEPGTVLAPGAVEGDGHGKAGQGEGQHALEVDLSLDALAREVHRETFFHTRESGGTMISSAYKLCKEMMDADYDTGSWNIYPFHFSDGDNWSADDTRTCVNLLKAEILTKVNQFAYGQVESPYGSGQFIKDLREAFDGVENVALSDISNTDGIYNSIKDCLGQGS